MTILPPGKETAMARGVARDQSTAQVIHLFETHQREIMTYLYRLVRDRESARDLTQETFLRAFRARNQLGQIENPRAWLYRIATNLAFSSLKRGSRWGWLPWSATDDLRAQAETSEQAFTSTAVEEALLKLPAHYRAPLLLYEHYGLNVAELAAALELSESAVKLRLFRAREMFREAYAGKEGQ